MPRRNKLRRYFSFISYHLIFALVGIVIILFLLLVVWKMALVGIITILLLLLVVWVMALIRIVL
jgi:hypothetical protein